MFHYEYSFRLFLKIQRINFILLSDFNLFCPFSVTFGSFYINFHSTIITNVAVNFISSPVLDLVVIELPSISKGSQSK